MDIKGRIIRKGKMESTEVVCISMTEFGIADDKVYYRNIVISESSYDAFETNPDEAMLLDKYLEHNNINAAWKPYVLIKSKDNQPESQMQADFSRLFNDIQDEIASSQHTEAEIHKRIYNELSKQDTLIQNPLIIDVFNEAIKKESDLSDWENVFPFFK